MSALTYKGFVISETATTYTVLSERDKLPHVVQKKENRIEVGCILMPDGHICEVSDIILTNSRLYSACREYVYDIERKKRRYQKQKANSKKASEPTNTETNVMY